MSLSPNKKGQSCDITKFIIFIMFLLLDVWNGLTSRSMAGFNQSKYSIWHRSPFQIFQRDPLEKDYGIINENRTHLVSTKAIVPE